VTETSRSSGAKRRTKSTTRILIIAGALLVLPVLLRVFVFEAYEAEGPSMEPTLANGDRFVISKASYGLFAPFTDRALASWGTPSRGEIVVLKSPRDGIDVVKRIIGIAGDSVEIRDDVVYVNGESTTGRSLGRASDGELECLEETAGDVVFTTVHDPLGPPTSHPTIVVPADHVYVLGDHRDRSNDSRFIGPIPVSSIKGAHALDYWSSSEPLDCPTNN
jgi:signal peptidase I